MLKIFQARLQQYMNQELPDVPDVIKGRGGKKKAEEPEIKLPTSAEKAREFQKNIYLCFIDYAKAFVWITTYWKILKEMGLPDYLTCLLRNLYAGQEATDRTGHGTMDRF